MGTQIDYEREAEIIASKTSQPFLTQFGSVRISAAEAVLMIAEMLNLTRAVCPEYKETEVQLKLSNGPSEGQEE